MTQEAVASRTPNTSLPLRLTVFVYGVAAYLIAVATFLYLIGFVGNVAVSKSVDGGAVGAPATALAVNLGLIALFGLQHSVMARPGFKKRWKKLVPAPVERSTYVLLTAAALIVLMVFWRPMPTQIWLVENPAGAVLLWTFFGAGWLVVFLSTFMTDHFDLFGLRQVFLYLAGRPYTPVPFKARWLYRHMRHPLYSGFLLAFWATPDMTVGHLVLAAGLSAYIVIGTLLEERDLLSAFGEHYRNYCRELPRYLPRLSTGKRRSP